MPNDGNLFEGILDMSSDDLLIAVSFPRYSQPIIEMMKQAKLRNVKVVSITAAMLRLWCPIQILC